MDTTSGPDLPADPHPDLDTSDTGLVVIVARDDLG
jgi:hypothetical protein